MRFLLIRVNSLSFGSLRGIVVRYRLTMTIFPVIIDSPRSQVKHRSHTAQNKAHNRFLLMCHCFGVLGEAVA